MDIKAGGHSYKVSFKHEAGPPSRLADLLTIVSRASTLARTSVARSIDALDKQRVLSENAAEREELAARIGKLTEDLRRLVTPEMAVQAVLDKVDKNLRLARRARIDEGMAEVERAISDDTAGGIEGVLAFLRKEEGLGRSARRPYRTRTLCTVWLPRDTDKDGHIKRPAFGDPKDTSVLGHGETKCSDLDVYTREEGRAKALARAVVDAGLDQHSRIAFGLQAFTAPRGRAAYFAEFEK